MNPDPRESAARSAASALRAADPASLRFVVGFDGFVDSIVHLVARRTSMAPDQFERIRTISEFAARCAAAAGRSTNIERVIIEDRFGGNGPLLAGALASLGSSVSFFGAIGLDADSPLPAPIFRPFAARCAHIVALAAPGHTEALEFDDGKLMLNETSSVQQVTWSRVLERVGLEPFTRSLDGAAMLGMVNWSLCGGVGGIWDGLANDVLPNLRRPPPVFVDLSDPAKRTDDDLAGALDQLRAIERRTPVTLGLNLAEADRIGSVLGIRMPDREAQTRGAALAEFASLLRGSLSLSALLIHPREGAAGATASESSWVDGPFTRSPRLSTGAGDHFNAGFCFARALGLGLESALLSGVALSGAYVRDARSPDRARLAGFLEALPAPEQPSSAPSTEDRT